ncbi:MAG: class I SAM-dependent methyltransferase [Cyanobacteriota bacterium]|nr:class I SAM-dependent methyltransferase [Cyanobacteriota bacterium]
MDVLEYYLHTAPSIQTTLDIFKGEWTSKFPSKYGAIESGTVPLFGDNRIAWSMEQLGGVKGKTVLELGSLEGAHTSMFESWGAASIVAIEAHSRAYLRSLIVKEVLGLQRARFLYGDCIEYLTNNPEPVDICCASGLLYHMTNPVKLLWLISRICNGVAIWTHYYDRNIINRNPALKERFPSSEEVEYEGFKHTLYRQNYASELQSEKFIGGQQRYTQWMSRQAILDCLEYLGFGDIKINFEIPEHPHGPSFSLTAVKKKNRVTPTRPSLQSGENNGRAVMATEMPKPSQRQAQTRIDELTEQLQQTKDRVRAMESSKFWKLRAQWFKVKSLLGLPTD